MFDFAALPYLLAEWLAAAIAALTLGLVWRRRARSGARALAVTLAAVVWWSFWHGVSLVAATLPAKEALAGVWYPGAALVTPTIIMFALEYLRQAKLARRWVAALLILPLAANVMLWTDPWLHLFWRRTFLVTGPPFTRLGLVQGPGSIGFAIWTAACLVAFTVLVLLVCAQHRGLYRRQMALLFAGLGVPGTVYLLFITGHDPVPSYDVTTLSLTVGFSLIGWAVYGQKLLDIIPVAHKVVIEGLGDAVLVLDEHDRVVYSNASAELFAGPGEPDIVGQPIASALPELAGLLAEGAGELVRGVGAAQRLYEVRVSALRNGPSGGGRVVVLRDETDRRRVSELQRSRQQVLAAEESVRRRIADMLHGPIQSKLLSAWMRLGQCDERWGQALSPEARALMAGVREDIDRIREEDIRRASHLLHPAGLRVGLLPALDYLAGGYEDFFAVDVAASEAMLARDAVGRGGLSEELRLIAYRVVEEALNNAAKHAGASRVEVRLDIGGGSLEVEVQDDGRGFDPARVLPGFGFHGIGSRVEHAGGAWEVHSGPGEGALLRVRLPVVEGASEAGATAPLRYTQPVPQGG